MECEIKGNIILYISTFYKSLSVQHAGHLFFFHGIHACTFFWKHHFLMISSLQWSFVLAYFFLSVFEWISFEKDFNVALLFFHMVHKNEFPVYKVIWLFINVFHCFTSFLCMCVSLPPSIYLPYLLDLSIVILFSLWCSLRQSLSLWLGIWNSLEFFFALLLILHISSIFCQ